MSLKKNEIIILTGGAGFIGSCILAALNDRGHREIVVVDSLASQDLLKKKNLENKTFQEYIDKKDFLRRIQANQFPTHLRCLIHMGACSSTTLNDPHYYEENNYLYSRTLATWALKHRVSLIYASSAATYGDGSLGYSDDPTLIPRLQPLNHYGWSKQKLDVWLLNQGYLDKVVGLKFFNVFGPNEYHKGDMRSVVAKAYDRVGKEGQMALFKSYKNGFGHGEQRRDFIYINDAVKIVLYFFDHPQIHGIFNVGTGIPRTWNDLANALFAAVGKEPRIEYIDMPEHLKAQYQYCTQAEITKLRLNGFTHSFLSLEEAVQDYVRYLKELRHI